MRGTLIGDLERGIKIFFCFICKKIDFLKFNLLSNGLIEKFWDALWLGIGPFLCFICKQIDFLKFNLLSNGLIEKFWDALWLGIGPFLCLTGVAYPCEAFLKTAPPILARLLTKTTPIDAYHEIWRYASCRISEMHITPMGGGPRLKPFNTPIGMKWRD